MFDYLKELNSAQRKAVQYIDGPSLIIAGAGSGKTRVLTYKIVYLLDQGYLPENILALTFTNKAADEMKQRIAKLEPAEKVRKLWMGTFHSIFAKILRAEAEYLGFSKNFTIYDAEDSKNEIAIVINELNLDTEVYKPVNIQRIISLAKNNLYTPETYENDSEIRRYLTIRKIPEVPTIFRHYQQRLKRANVMDFDDLLVFTNILLRDNPDILKKYQKKFQFILVDEYQDTNYAQYLILKQLAKAHKKISVVGDDSQSIYGFRGARIENILNFQRDFPEAKIFKLEQNYRSTQNILNVANSIIEKNENKIPKTLFTENEVGEKVKILEFISDKQEADFVAKKILEFVKQKNYSYRDIAVLYRANHISRLYEQIMRKYNIPYKVFGGFSFYQRKEIKDILSYLKSAVNLQDDQALIRIINIPKRGIGNSTINKLISLADANKVPIWLILESLEKLTNYFSQLSMKRLLDFRELIRDFNIKSKQLNARDFVEYVFDKSGLKNYYLTNLTKEENYERYENLQEFINDVSQFMEENQNATIVDFLQNVSLMSSVDKTSGKETDFVSLMTVHSAKGLEFPIVFITAMVDGLFPVSTTIFSLKEIEEERRLFYVATTRAKKHLFISYSISRMLWGRYEYTEPSRFISEIDDKFIIFESQRPKIERPSDFQPDVEFYDQRPSKEKLIKISERPSDEPEKIREYDELTGMRSGMLVKHNKFGIGTIIHFEGEGDNTKALIDFPKVGKKKLLLKFAKLQIVKK